MNKRRLLASVLCSVLLVAAYPLSASAHELETDGTISAELHVEPYDHPVAGQKTTYHVSFEEEPAAFSLQNYTTTITIRSGSKTIATQPFVAAEPTESTDTFTFPNAANYTIRVQGKPKQTGKQPAFMLNFPVVVQAGKAAAPINPAWWIGGGIVLIGLVATALTMERSSKRRTATPEQ